MLVVGVNEGVPVDPKVFVALEVAPPKTIGAVLEVVAVEPPKLKVGIPFEVFAIAAVDPVDDVLNEKGAAVLVETDALVGLVNEDPNANAGALTGAAKVIDETKVDGALDELLRLDGVLVVVAAGAPKVNDEVELLEAEGT